VVEETTGKTMVEQAIAAIGPDSAPEQAAASAPRRAQSTAPLRLFPDPAASPANAAEPPSTPASTVDAAPARPRSLLPPPPA